VITFCWTKTYDNNKTNLSYPNLTLTNQNKFIVIFTVTKEQMGWVENPGYELNELYLSEVLRAEALRFLFPES
jgi:hypothetical protein